MVLKPDPKAPEDAGALARADLVVLEGLLRQARRPAAASPSSVTRAHLADCAARVHEALTAQAQRAVE